MRWAVSEIPLVKRTLRGRWLQWGLTVITLAVFLLVILSGLFGTPAGNHNFGIIYVWLVWWALLKLVLVPFMGRSWCSICPIPAPGDWLQRRAIITPRQGGRMHTILGLAVWVAFTLSFTLTNISYAWPALSDPFGWGWNLLGTASMNWTPYLPGVIPYLQVPVLLAGLIAAVALTLRTAHQHQQRSLAALPVSAFCALAVVALLTLYMA